MCVDRKKAMRIVAYVCVRDPLEFIVTHARVIEMCVQLPFQRYGRGSKSSLSLCLTAANACAFILALKTHIRPRTATTSYAASHIVTATKAAAALLSLKLN